MARQKLEAQLGLDTKEFDKGLKNSAKGAEQFGNKVKGMGTMVVTAFTAGGVAVAIKTIQKIFQSTDGSADLLEKKIMGVQAVATTAAQNIANLDWSVSLRDAKRAAEEYAEVLDDLGDRQRSIGIISAKNSAEAAKLRGILRNVNISEEERLKASARMTELATEEMRLRGDAAQEGLDGIINQNIQKYKGLKLTLQDAEAINDYVSNYAYFTKAQHDALSYAQEAQKILENNVTQGEFIAKGYGTSNDYAKELNAKQKRLVELTALVPPELQKYIALWRPINDMGDEQRNAIAQIYKEWYNANAGIQNYLNIAERVEGRINNIKDGVSEIAHGKETGISTGAGQAALPRITGAPDSESITQPLNDGTAWLAMMDTQAKQTLDTLGAVGGAFDTIGSSIDNAAGSWISYIGNVLSTIPGLIEGLAAVTAAEHTKAAASGVAAGAGAASSVASVPFVGPVLAIAAIASVMGALLSMPKLANGGMAYGPTSAIIGEYPGASSNPEVISPLSKLKDAIGDTGGVVHLTAKLKGRDIYLSGTRYSNSLNKNS